MSADVRERRAPQQRERHLPAVRILLPIVLLCAACASDWTVSGSIVERQVDAKARGLDVVRVNLFAPGNGSALADGPFDGVVLAPGGLVPAERYFWLARALAERGFAVAVPKFPLQLGFFAADDVQVARRVLVEGDAASDTPPLARRVAVAGHSLGGVVAAGAAVDGGFDALVLFASYAAGGDDVEGLRIPVLSIAGAMDCTAPRAKVHEGFTRFAGDATFAELAGATHYSFTDTDLDDVESGCTPSLPIDTAHATIEELVATFLRSRLSADVAARDRFQSGFPGVTYEVAP